MNAELFANMKTIPLVVIVIGMIVVFLSSGTDVYSLMTGYSSMLAGFLVLLAWVFNYIGNTTNQNKVLTMLPFAFIIGIIGTLLVYFSMYFKQISANMVSQYYTNFSSILMIFIFIQSGLFISTLTSKAFETTQSLGTTNTSILMLLSAINFILVITVGIVLHFYKTDG